MPRSSPIRDGKSRRPSKAALRAADLTFWLTLIVAAMLGYGQIASGFPKLLGLLIPLDAAAAEPGPAPARTVVVLDMAGVSVSHLADVPQLRQGDDVFDTVLTRPIRPSVAIVIDDLGGDPARTRDAIALPPAVALSFLPYPRQTPRLARAARRAGHEVLVHVPMEAEGGPNPGPMALTTAMPAAEIVRRLDWSLSRVAGFSGINNHEGSRFTADRDALAPVMRVLAARGGYFFDSRTTANTQVMASARAYGVSSAERDVFLDDVLTMDAVDDELRALEQRARDRGVAIAIGHPHAMTLDAVAYWAAHEKAFDLVPLSVAIRRKAIRERRRSLALAGG